MSLQVAFGIYVIIKLINYKEDAMKIKRKSLLLLILSLGLALTACNPKYKEIDDLSKLISNNELEESDQLLDRLMDQYQGETQAYIELAAAYREKNPFKSVEILTSSLDQIQDSQDKDQILILIADYSKSTTKYSNGLEALKKLQHKTEESGLLALDLNLLAEDADALKEAYESYRQLEDIRKSELFFNRALVAFTEMGMDQEILELADYVEELGLQLEVGYVLAAYDFIKNLSPNYEELLTKNIYNKDLAQLELVRELDESTSLVGIQPEKNSQAYFVQLDPLDNRDQSQDLVLRVYDGLTGRLVDSFSRKDNMERLVLGSFRTEDGGDLIYLYSQDSNLQPLSAIDFFSLEKGKIIPLERPENTDLIVELKDDFKYVIKSETLDISQEDNLFTKDYDYYKEKSIYNNKGQLIGSKDQLLSQASSMSIRKDFYSSDSLVFSTFIEDRQEEAEFLNLVESFYKFKDKDFRPDSMEISSRGHLEIFPGPEYLRQEEVFSEFFQGFMNLLGLDIESLAEEQGFYRDRPDERFLDYKYKGFAAYYNEDNIVDKIFITAFAEDFPSPDDIFSVFGQPSKSYFNKEELEDIYEYRTSDHIISFSKPADEYDGFTFIEIKNK